MKMLHKALLVSLCCALAAAVSAAQTEVPPLPPGGGISMEYAGPDPGDPQGGGRVSGVPTKPERQGPDPAAGALLRAENVTAGYGETVVLRDVSLAVRPASVVLHTPPLLTPM